MRGMRGAWPSCPCQHLLKFFHLGREIGRTLQLGDLEKGFGQSNPNNRARPERLVLLIVVFGHSQPLATKAVEHAGALFVCYPWAVPVQSLEKPAKILDHFASSFHVVGANGHQPCLPHGKWRYVLARRRIFVTLAWLSFQLAAHRNAPQLAA